jgi:N-acetylglutamate synthase-like GNAT family acetyltransferase
MVAHIRVADAADTEGVARLFARIYESGRGPGAARDQGLSERTIAVLFPDRDRPTVLVYVIDGDIEGVVAYRLDRQSGSASLITVQTHDTVRGRSAAQLLLSETARRCAAEGMSELVTDVPAADVRARGFLRREGFSAVVESDVSDAPLLDAVVTYQRLLLADLAVSTERHDGGHTRR